MILRTVHMTFKPEAIEPFLALFEAHKLAIASQPGCQSLQLIQDPTRPECIGTVSIWDRLADLDAYRNSALFAEVWPLTKAGFAKPPLAQSHSLLWAS